MNNIDVKAKLVEAFENGLIGDETLANINPAKDSPISALAEKLGVSSNSLDAMIHSLADTIQPEELGKDFILKSMFSYDGGMELSFYGSWGVSATGGAVCDFLKPNKVKAVESSKAIPVVIAGVAFWLLPQGVRSGCGSYSYVLLLEEDGRVKYRFYLHTSPCASIPGIRVKCEYQAFRRGRSLLSVNDELHQIIQILGYNLDKERLSRLDFNLTINHSMANINDAVKNDKILNRCEEVHTSGGRRFFCSYRVGSISNIEFAIYDKLRELRAHYDADKIQDLSDFFKGNLSEDLTRYEFRLGRSFLHAVGVETLQDYIDNEFAVVNYLTYNWYQVLEDDISKRYGPKKNFKVAPWWSQVRFLMLLAVYTQNFIIFCPISAKTVKTRELIKALKLNIIRRCEKIKEVVMGFPVIRRRPPRRVRKNLKRSVQIAVGCLASAFFASLPSGQVIEKAQFHRMFLDSVSFFSDDAFERYQKKYNYIEGIERNYSSLAVDDVLPIMGGACHA